MSGKAYRLAVSAEYPERGKKNTESVLGVVDFYGASAVTWSVIAQTQCHYQIHPTSLLYVLQLKFMNTLIIKIQY